MKNDVINAMAADAKATKAKTAAKKTPAKSKQAKQLDKDLDKLIAEKEAELKIIVHMYLRLGTKKLIYRGFHSQEEARAWFKLHVASYRNMLNAYDKDNFQYVITADVILKPFDKGGKK